MEESTSATLKLFETLSEKDQGRAVDIAKAALEGRQVPIFAIKDATTVGLWADAMPGLLEFAGGKPVDVVCMDFRGISTPEAQWEEGKRVGAILGQKFGGDYDPEDPYAGFGANWRATHPEVVVVVVNPPATNINDHLTGAFHLIDQNVNTVVITDGAAILDPKMLNTWTEGLFGALKKF